jgi:hypothetical protein
MTRRGRERWWGLFGLSAVLGLLCVGCATATNEQLVRRAAFDMRCPESQIQTIEIDSQTRGVRGCGQQAAYVERCDGPRQSAYACTWVLDARNDGAGSGQAPAPAASPPSTSTSPTSSTSPNPQPDRSGLSSSP